MFLTLLDWILCKIWDFFPISEAKSVHVTIYVNPRLVMGLIWPPRFRKNPQFYTKFNPKVSKTFSRFFKNIFSWHRLIFGPRKLHSRPISHWYATYAQRSMQNPARESRFWRSPHIASWVSLDELASKIIKKSQIFT